MNKNSFKMLAERWPSAIVARHEVGKFSGGLIHPRTLANKDSLGEGPRDRIVVGRKVAYTVEALIEWLEKRACA